MENLDYFEMGILGESETVDDIRLLDLRDLRIMEEF